LKKYFSKPSTKNNKQVHKKKFRKQQKVEFKSTPSEVEGKTSNSTKRNQQFKKESVNIYTSKPETADTKYKPTQKT
jgi:hypothetical protein